ncbi:MAG: phage terminase large subunit, partial [Aeromonas sp.]
MVKKLAVKLDRLEAEAATALGSGVNKMTVFGIVDMNLNVIRRWTRKGHEFVACDSVPDVLVPERLEPLLLKRKKYKVIYGGRGGAKSITAMDILAAEAKDFGSSVMCFREVQKSLKESVFKGLNGEIRRLGFEGFRSIESQGEIRHSNGALFSFWGLNTNLSNMKSLYGYKRFWTEEAETISQESLDT